MLLDDTGLIGMKQLFQIGNLFFQGCSNIRISDETLRARLIYDLGDGMNIHFVPYRFFNRNERLMAGKENTS